MITIFLGAGFSALGGVPLASQLFDIQPYADTVSRVNLLENVQYGWRNWHARTGGTPEQYLAHLEKNAFQKQWHDAVWYVALAVTLRMPRVKIVPVSFKRIKRVIGHTLVNTSGVALHESFWKAVFCQTRDVSVLTTNYDILIERGLRLVPRPTLPRPGFYYGESPERHQLEGRGYPGFFSSKPPETKGTVPLFKLHGSVSWALSGDEIVKYRDCRPAIRGDAAIIAPTREKDVSSAFQAIWNQAAKALAQSDVWIVVGYSFPEYDEAINELFYSNAFHQPRIHILNPDPNVAYQARTLFPRSKIHVHGGLPDSFGDLPRMLA